MSAASLYVLHSLITEHLLIELLGRVGIFDLNFLWALSIDVVLVNCCDAQGSIESLTPWEDWTIFTKSQSVRCTTHNLPYVAYSIYKSWDIANSILLIASAETSLAIASHRIYESSISLDKDSVLLSTADICHHNIEAANFWQIVDNFLASNSQLSIVVI